MGQINIVGEIGREVFAEDVIAEIDSYGPKEPLSVFVLSNGGCVEQGLRIFNRLDRHRGPVAVHIDKADSVAASFSQAGTPGLRTMAANGEIMIHLPMIRLEMANELDLENLQDFLKVQKSRLISTLKPTGLSTQKLGEMFDNETFLDAESAKALGFIDEIVQNSKAVAMIKFFGKKKSKTSARGNPEEKQIHAQGDEDHEAEARGNHSISQMLEKLTEAGIEDDLIVEALGGLMGAGDDDEEREAMADEKGEEGDMTGGGVRRAIRTAQDQGYTIEEIGAAVDRDASTLQAILSGEIDNPPAGLAQEIRELPPKAEPESEGQEDEEKMKVRAMYEEEKEVRAMYIEKFYNEGKLTKAQLKWANTQTSAQLKAWAKTAPQVVSLATRPDFKKVEAETESQIPDPEVSKTGTVLRKTFKT